MKKELVIWCAGGIFVLAGMYMLGNTQKVLRLFYTVESAIVPREIPRHLTTPEQVHAIYMSSWVAGTPDLRASLVDFVDQNQALNSLIVDVKDYSGRVAFQTGNDLIASVGSEEERIKDIASFINDLHRRGIYVIARITVFQDPYYARVHPEAAIKHANGGMWRDKNGLAYIDPKAKDFWRYIEEIAKASEAVGFDELNFDYIRFPSDGPIREARYPFWDAATQTRADALDEFFTYLRASLLQAEIGVPLSADVFGLTTWQEDDMNIGQMLERIAPHFDYLAPMVYPSHYPRGFQGFVNPANHPYEIIKTAMDRAVFRLGLIKKEPRMLRPWLQDFDLGATYDAAMIQKQIQAVEDSGLSSWMMWNAANRYTREAY